MPGQNRPPERRQLGVTRAEDERLCTYPAEALLDAAGVKPGHRVLDAGTGTVAASACVRAVAAVPAPASTQVPVTARPPRQPPAQPPASPVTGALPRPRIRPAVPELAPAAKNIDYADRAGYTEQAEHTGQASQPVNSRWRWPFRPTTGSTHRTRPDKTSADRAGVVESAAQKG